MNAEAIIAIVTAGLAFVTSLATFSFNISQSRRSKVQKVVLENRIKYMNEMRDGFTELIGLANAESILLAMNNADIKQQFAVNLWHGYGKIKTYIKPFYAIDKALLDSLDKLFFCIISALNDNKSAYSELRELCRDFEDKYLKYDWAYWKYIQSQREGVFMDSDDAFDNVYYKFVESLNQKSDLHTAE